MARQKQNEETIIKSIPATESGNQTECKTKSGKVYLITNNPLKEKFTLWEVLDNGYKKLSVSSNPLEFDEVIY